ncbi:fibrobacter succinogenes major paralogous domain-containing protein [Patescibacteria group bacterium]|nr:fibrobacter succinogenes major paralogous domain-containing protein [Patescibacteria group bacterium]
MEKLELEPDNFRIDYRGWKEITINDKKYLVNPQGDIYQIIGGEADGEQLFTWHAAMRETAKVGKRMPTDEEFSKILKTKADMPNLVLAGYRHTNGSFFIRGAFAYFWSSTESGATAWTRNLISADATVYRNAGDKAYGFSVRCLKN